MNINWVLSDSAIIPPDIDIEKLKNIGSFWGGWRTWRAYATDNVICNDLTQSNNLIKRNFQKECNFYIPDSSYQNLGRPQGVRLYNGEFVHDVDNRDEIVSMHLVSGSSDIVLLLGFDLSEPLTNPDKLLEHRANNYRRLVRQAIADNKHVQWILVDHPDPVMKIMSNLDNLSTDTMSAVLALPNI